MYDAFYDGVFDEAYDTVPYSELSKKRSQEYKWLSGTRSDVYEFYCDFRGELWGDDIEKAENKLVKFREDIDKLKKKDSSKEVKNAPESAQNPTPTAEPKADDKEENKQEENEQETSISIRPKFKEALDSYEEFF